MSKTFVLNIENLNTQEDVQTIKHHFQGQDGVEKIEVEFDLNIVSLTYNEQFDSPNKLFEALESLGYPVK